VTGGIERYIRAPPSEARRILNEFDVQILRPWIRAEDFTQLALFIGGRATLQLRLQEVLEAVGDVLFVGSHVTPSAFSRRSTQLRSEERIRCKA
jgi:hypothetical protein